MENRFFVVDAIPEENTSEHNRINEVCEAARFQVAGIVDEHAGGVIAYVHVNYADAFVAALNDWNVAL